MADIKISGKLVNDTDDKLADGSQIMVDIGGSEKSLQSAIDDDDIGGGSELDEVLEKGSGSNSVKMVDAQEASGSGSLAEGYASASGEYSHAEGYDSTSSGKYSHAEGDCTEAKGESSHAEGASDSESTVTIASVPSISKNGSVQVTVDDDTYRKLYVGLTSTNGCVIYLTQRYQGVCKVYISSSEAFAGGTLSFIVGRNVSNGVASHTEGIGSVATGYGAHAEGKHCVADEDFAHAEGKETKASGGKSHAEGYKTIASSEYSHAEGGETIADKEYAHAEGDRSNANGIASHAEGCDTKSRGAYSHAEGDGTITIGQDSHAEGASTIAIGNSSHAEGYGDVGQVVTSSAYSASSTQVGGVYTGSSNFDFVGAYVVSRDGSFCKKITSSEVHGSDTAFLFGSAIGVAIPNNTTLYIRTGAFGTNSHAEGEQCRAIANNSHAEGQCTKTSNIGEHAEGRYNNSHTDTIHSVGIGSASASKNAHEIMVDGTHYLGDGTIYNCQYGDSNKDSKKIVPVSLSEQTLTVGSSSIVIPSSAGAGGWDVYNTTSALYGIGFRPQTIGETVTQVGELDIVSTDGNRVFDLRAYSEPCQFDILIKDRTPFETVIYFKGIDTIDIGHKVGASISISDIVDVNDEPDLDTNKTYMVSIQYASIVWAEITPRQEEEEETTDE